MKKIIILSIFIAGFFILNNNKVFADWWERPTVQPTQPSIERPTTAPSPTLAPTSPPSQPTVTPPPSGGVPTSAPTPTPTSSPSGGGGKEDPCAPGKSYVGPHCGWSPRVGGEEGGGGEVLGVTTQEEGPEVLGLSYTSSRDLTISDIMLLAGVLCLLLYARSKTAAGKSV